MGGPIVNKTFSVADRVNFIKKMEQEEFDLLIVGGGINGAGVARDAASRGMRVALVEAKDFSEGTSSRSSKLIHGGLRYLENFDFHLVFEALSERALLFEIAPHLVHPLRFMIPLYKNSRVGPFKMGLGMWLYDTLALFQTPEMHEYFPKEKALKQIPILKSKELRGAFLYSDAYMDDDRLTIETLRSANELGAISVNHVAAEEPLFNPLGELMGFKCRDHIGQKLYEVRAKHIVSTVGPWTDYFGKKSFKKMEKHYASIKRGSFDIFEKKFTSFLCCSYGSPRADSFLEFREVIRLL